jgi:hypothetical protein
MRLGIIVTYLFSSETEFLLPLHLGQIRKFTDVPYTIYGSVNRLESQFRSQLAPFAEVRPCEFPQTEFRQGEEHGYYLDGLAKIAIEDGSTHLVTLHLDSFPISSGWAAKLKALTDETGTCVVAEGNFSACLFFTREFYLRYQPKFRGTFRGFSYERFLKRNRLKNHSGVSFLYVCFLNHLRCHYLPSRQSEQGEILGGSIFHLIGAIRATSMRDTSPLPGLFSLQILKVLLYFKQIPFIHGCWMMVRKWAPFTQGWLRRKENVVGRVRLNQLNEAYLTQVEQRSYFHAEYFL